MFFLKFLIFFIALTLIPLQSINSADYNNIKQHHSSHQILKHSKETFSFDISWMGIYVGKASFEAKQDKGTITITSKVNSAPVISTIYKVDDYAKSEVVNGKPLSFKIKQHEGRYRSNKETIFDTENKKIIFLNHLKGERYEHISILQTYWDVISGFYYIRNYPFEVGKSFYVSIFDSNKFYNAEIKVIGKEKIKVSENWKTDTIIIKPVLQSDGLFKRKGDILIWLSDDEKRIPVKVETSVKIGKIIATIKTVETEN